jgi:type I restriction enzyme S subunit
MSNSLGNNGMHQIENGSLPNDWRFVKLGQVSYEVTERNHDLHHSRTDVLGVNNESGLIASDRLLGEDFSRYKLVRENQFAYNPMRLNVGSIGLWSTEQGKIVSPDYIVFGCKEDQIDPDYLDLFRQSTAWKQQIQQSGQGSVRIRYYYRHISEFLIPLPPLTEQKAIAHVLRIVQQAKEATEKVIAATRQLKLSLMKHLFTYGPVPFDQADKVELTETEIGPVPTHWQIVRLVEVCELSSGGTPSKKKPEYWVGPIPWASPKDMKAPRLWDTEDHISEEGLREGSRLAPAGTIFMVVRGMILAKDMPIALAMVPMAFNQDMKAVIPGKNIQPDYLLYAIGQLKHSLRKEIGTSAHGTRRIGTTAIEKFRIPVPSITEQSEIVAMLSGIDKKLIADENKLKALMILFQSALNDLMTGKVRVQLDADQLTAEAV